MEEIYWKVFGTTSITNYEMLAQIVCSFTTKSKDIDINYFINWAKVVESTTKEKAHGKDEVNINGH